MAETYSEVKEALSRLFSIDESSISMNTNLRDDLGLDSSSLSKLSEYLYSGKSAFSEEKANIFSTVRELVYYFEEDKLRIEHEEISLSSFYKIFVPLFSSPSDRASTKKVNKRSDDKSNYSGYSKQMYVRVSEMDEQVAQYLVYTFVIICILGAVIGGYIGYINFSWLGLFLGIFLGVLCGFFVSIILSV